MSPKSDDPVDKTKSGEAEPEGEKKEKSSKTEKDVVEDLSEEDKKLKEELELCVTRLQEPDQKVF